MRILHISDTHLSGDGNLHRGAVDAAAALERVLRAADGLANVDLVLCSGDLSDDGSPASYRILRDVVEDWAGRHSAATAYLMGNHDERVGFEEVLGERTGVVEAAGVRVIRLDSSVPGKGYGEIGPAQMRWLVETLAASSMTTIVALHHPPVPALTPLLRGLELQQPEELLSVCADAGVTAILAGHFHHSLATAVLGIPVYVAPAVVNTTDITAPIDHERAVAGSAFAVVDAGGPGDGPEVPRHSSVQATARSVAGPGDGAVIFDFGPEQIAQILAEAGAPQ